MKKYDVYANELSLNYKCNKNNSLSYGMVFNRDEITQRTYFLLKFTTH